MLTLPKIIKNGRLENSIGNYTNTIHRKDGVFFMRIIKRQMQKTIQGNCPEDYDRQVNEAMEDLKMHSPKKDRDSNIPFLCYIDYVVTEKIPETAEDEAELKGLLTLCEFCPHFEDAHKGNQKRGGCGLGVREWTRCDYHACERYYMEILGGAE